MTKTSLPGTDRGATDSERSVSSVFPRSERALRRFVARYLLRQQDIEDVVQEAFLRAFDAERDRPIRSPKAFLFRIARNIALKELTRKSRRITDYIEDFAAEEIISGDPPVEEQVEMQQNLARFCEVVATLPVQCRRVFLLRKVHGLSHAQIAERLGISVSTVEKHVASGLYRCSVALRRGDEGVPQARDDGVVRRRRESGRD